MLAADVFEGVKVCNGAGEFRVDSTLPSRYMYYLFLQGSPNSRLAVRL